MSLLFPAEPRNFVGKRWLDIVLRSLHLLGIAGIAGGFLFDLPKDVWLSYWHLTIVSGGLMAIVQVWASGIWLFQVKGLAIIVKIVLLIVALKMPEWRVELFSAIVLISGISAHAPGQVRGRMLLFKSLKKHPGC